MLEVTSLQLETTPLDIEQVILYARWRESTRLSLGL